MILQLVSVETLYLTTITTEQSFREKFEASTCFGNTHFKNFPLGLLFIMVHGTQNQLLKVQIIEMTTVYNIKESLRIDKKVAHTPFPLPLSRPPLLL